MISKYSCGGDGLPPHERLHGEKCLTPLVPFGERVLYLPFKTVRRDKGDVAKRAGTWMGVISMTQEVIIGIEHGVIKCKIVARLPDNEKWDAQQIARLHGPRGNLCFGKQTGGYQWQSMNMVRACK